MRIDINNKRFFVVLISLLTRDHGVGSSDHFSNYVKCE